MFDQSICVLTVNDNPKVVMWSYFTVAIAGEMLGIFQTAQKVGQGKLGMREDHLTLTLLFVA